MLPGTYLTDSGLERTLECFDSKISFVMRGELN